MLLLTHPQDLLDLEMVGAPIQQPGGSLSITDPACGAIAGDGQDDRVAIEACISTAQQQGLSVWIPPGTFDLATAATIYVNSIAIAGAGMWHSVMSGTTKFRCTTNCSFSDFAVFGLERTRRSGSYHAFYGDAGLGTRLTNIWVEHTVRSVKASPCDFLMSTRVQR